MGAAEGSGAPAAAGGTVLGVVRELHRHPVKSMRGERPDRVRIGAGGVEGDRSWALLRGDRRWASAKADKRRWTLVPGMLDLRAETRGDGRVAVTLPDGDVVLAGDPGADARLSGHLGVAVAFDEGDRGARWGRHHDAAPLHLVTTATLAALAGDDGLALDARRLRPNLVVELGAGGSGVGGRGPGGPDGGGGALGEAAAFPENDWPGLDLRVGGALLRVTERTGRCVMTTRPQGDDLPRDAGVLKRAGRRNGADAGVYLAVLEPGEVAVGDLVVAVGSGPTGVPGAGS